MRLPCTHSVSKPFGVRAMVPQCQHYAPPICAHNMFKPFWCRIAGATMRPLCVHTGLEGERWSHSVPTMRPLLAHYMFQPFWVESMRPLMWQLCAHYATNMGPNRPTMCPPFPDYFYKPFWGWSDGSGVPPRCAHYRAKPFWGSGAWGHRVRAHYAPKLLGN